MRPMPNDDEWRLRLSSILFFVFRYSTEPIVLHTRIVKSRFRRFPPLFQFFFYLLIFWVIYIGRLTWQENLSVRLFVNYYYLCTALYLVQWIVCTVRYWMVSNSSDSEQIPCLLPVLSFAFVRRCRKETNAKIVSFCRWFNTNAALVVTNADNLKA